jgi:hypothetical protein
MLIVSQDEDINAIHDQLVGEYGDVTFEAFINLLVSNRTWALGHHDNCPNLLSG